MEKLTLKQRAINAKNSMVEKAKKIGKEVKENPQVSAAVIALFGTLLSLNVTSQELQMKRQDRLTYTDPNTNVTWDLKRRPKNDENAAIARAARKNENVEEVLSDFNLLK